MARTVRVRFSASQRRELWRRWRAGQSLSDIGRELGKAPATIFGIVVLEGGISPPVRTRSHLALRLVEREEISRGIASGESMRQIAAALGRAPSTISREIARNGGANRYRACDADGAAWKRTRRPKPCRLAIRRRLQKIVSEKLALNWSPEQISGWLRQRYPGKAEMQISHETIYRSLFVQARGVLKRELLKHLRTRRLMRRSKHASTRGQARGQIVDAISIRERPAAVEDRAVPGHWEGDLLSGAKNTHIATLVERQSRFTMLVKVKGKDAESVKDALIRKVKGLPAELRQTLTWDRGSEMAKHKEFSVATDVRVYFCDPHSPWQRGTNENTNRLLRQYFPKGTDLSVASQVHLNQIARQLNQRPRKTLDFRSPADALSEALR